MKKVGEKISNVWKVLKKLIEKFPLTMIGIFLLTLMCAISIDNDLISSTILANVLLFVVIFVSSTFLIETLLEDKRKIIYYVISAVWAALLTWATNLKENLFGLSNEVFLFRMNRMILCYVIAVILLAIYYQYKKSNKTVENYLTSIFVSLVKTSLIYGILAIGIAIVTAIFVYLILDGASYVLIAKMEILLFGIYYLPTILYSFYKQEKEIGKFAKIVIRYVLGTLVMIAFVIVYMYIVKIIILRQIPSNQIFRILSALFIIALPIWTMNLAFSENKTFDKINQKLPLLFVPFILLQIYSIGVRIQGNGVTELRYLCIMLILFEIAYTILYLKNQEKVYYMLLVLVLITVLSTIVPYLNMFTISNLSQSHNLKIYKQNSTYTEEEKDKIYGAYSYLKSSVEGQKYINRYLTEEQINEIIDFQLHDTGKNHTTRLYAIKNTDYIDINGYNRFYFIHANSSKTNDELGTVDEIFSDISFDIQESNHTIELNILSSVYEYVENAQNLNTYFRDTNEWNIDDNRKIILRQFSLEYDETTRKVSYYNIYGYLLEK